MKFVTCYVALLLGVVSVSGLSCYICNSTSNSGKYFYWCTITNLIGENFVIRKRILFFRGRQEWLWPGQIWQGDNEFNIARMCHARASPVGEWVRGQLRPPEILLERDAALVLQDLLEQAQDSGRDWHRDMDRRRDQPRLLLRQTGLPLTSPRGRHPPTSVWTRNIHWILA